MYATLMRAIGDSSTVAFVRLGPSAKATVQGIPMLRVGGDIVEAFKGVPSGARRLDFLVPEPPVMDDFAPGREVIVFLALQGGDLRVTEYSDLLEVPQENREAFLGCVRDTVLAVAPGADPAARRDHVVKMLRSGIELFQEDAARTAVDMEGFTGLQIQIMIDLVTGDDRHEPVGGMTRESLIPAVMKNAEVARAAEFGKGLLAGGTFREIYFGLAERDPAEAEEVVKSFLGDPEEKVQAGGLLVAGLLRREDLIDGFAGRFTPDAPPPSALRDAIGKAREFVERDL